MFGLEASGPYTQPLLAWLLQQEAQVCLFNPLQIYRFRRAQSLRRTKTDAIDACTIRDYMAECGITQGNARKTATTLRFSQMMVLSEVLGPDYLLDLYADGLS